MLNLFLLSIALNFALMIVVIVFRTLWLDALNELHTLKKQLSIFIAKQHEGEWHNSQNENSQKENSWLDSVTFNESASNLANEDGTARYTLDPNGRTGELISVKDVKNIDSQFN